MRMIRILALFAALLATASFTADAFACPAGYFPCGGACCPRR